MNKLYDLDIVYKGDRDPYHDSGEDLATAVLSKEQSKELRLGVVELIEQVFIEKAVSLGKEKINFNPKVASKAEFPVVERATGNFVAPDRVLPEISGVLKQELIGHKLVWDNGKLLSAIEITEGLLRGAVFASEAETINLNGTAKNNIVEVKEELEQMLDIAASAAESLGWSVLCCGAGKQCQIDTSVETFGEDWQIGAKAAPFITALLAKSQINFSADTGAQASRRDARDQIRIIGPIKSIKDWAEVLADAKHKDLPFWRYFLSRSDHGSVWDAMMSFKPEGWLDYQPTRSLTHELSITGAPSSALLVVPEAIILGLLSARQEFFAEFNNMPWSDINYYRKRAQLDGVGYHEVDPMRTRTRQIVEIAKAGLIKRGLGEEAMLGEAFKVLESASTAYQGY